MKLIPKLLIIFCLFGCNLDAQTTNKPKIVNYSDIVVGAAQTEVYLPMLKNKKIGIVANQTSLVNKTHTVDLLIDLGLDVKKVFCPEHGFRGNKPDGELINNQKDAKTGLPVISLYGKHYKPTPEDLKDIDVIIFDIQDVGVRFYTYLSTMTYVMEACAVQNIPVIIFDRPNPNGFYIDGPVLKPEFKSIIGLHPVPIVHATTPGEFALMINGESWLENNLKCDLQIVKMGNYEHNQTMDLPVKPSPNLPTFSSVLLYPSLALFEGTVVSIGRGTDFPFQVIGHPLYADKSFAFTPRSIPEASLNPPLKGQECFGVDLRNLKINQILNNRKLSLKWLIQFYNELGNKTDFFNAYFEKLAGDDQLRKQIENGLSEQEIRESWKKEITKYKKIRAKYLLYPDFE